jgi:hypothetical protein
VATGRNRKKKSRPNQAAVPKSASVHKPKPAKPVSEVGRSRFWRLARLLPRTFQGRLSLAFIMVFALSVGLVSILAVVVLDTDLRAQEETNLEARANAVAAVVRVKAETAAQASPGNATVVSAGGVLNDSVLSALAPTTLSPTGPTTLPRPTCAFVSALGLRRRVGCS